jgi:hypothetical protein
MMSDILKHILADAALMGLITACFAFVVKKWIAQTLEHHFKASLEREKAFVEIEKTKELNILQNQSTALPQFVELIYRLRNEFRQKMEMLNDQTANYPGDSDSMPSITGFGEELYLLTDTLYKFRIFLDDSTFEVLHQSKRALQDANVLINTLTRPLDPNDPFLLKFDPNSRDEAFRLAFKSNLEKVMPELKERFETVEHLYPEIVKRAKAQMQTFLHGK